MRIGRNIAASIAASSWAAVVGLAVVPYYVRLLGIEAFGLIGFFGTLQALFYVLDLGLAATMNREIARFTAGGRRSDASALLSTLAWIYWFSAIGIAFTVILGAPLISYYWLQASALSQQKVSESLMLMGVVIALRWPTGLYQGVLQGGEQIVLASAISAVTTMLSNLGALFVLTKISTTLEAFFLWQAIVGIFQVTVTRYAAIKLIGRGEAWRFDFEELKRVWRFSAGLGITAILAVTIMQLDKIILSRLVSLESFGYYALAGLAPRSLYLLLTPVFTVVYPRLSRLHAQGKECEVEVFYRNGTRILLAFIFPLAASVAVFGTEIFTLWTGNPTTAAIAAPVAMLLLLGTAANGAMHFPYALQLAYGESSLPARINLVLVALFIPLVSLLASKFGIMGGAAAWAIINIFYLFFGSILTHRSILKGLGRKWLVEDVGIPAVISVAIVGGAGILLHQVKAPLLVAISGGIGAALLAAASIVAVSPELVRAGRSLLEPKRPSTAVK